MTGATHTWWGANWRCRSSVSGCPYWRIPADPEKGTGVVMCCTFGDSTDVAWWREYKLPLVEAFDSPGAHDGRGGRIQRAAGGGGSPPGGEKRLEGRGLILARRATEQSVRVHERCDTPVEYLHVPSGLCALDFKDELLEAGERIQWYPTHMRARYRAWVEEPELGLVHLAPAFLRGPIPGLVL